MKAAATVTLAGVAAGLAVGGCALIAGLPDEYSGTVDASSGSDTGTPDGIVDAGNPRFAQLLRACMLVAGCDPVIPEWSVSYCLSNDLISHLASMACTVNASTCNDVYACLGRSPAFSGGAQCGGKPSRCDGTQAVTCYPDGRIGTVIDCSTSAPCGTFSVDGELRAACQVKASCNDTDGAWHCDPSSGLYYCADGKGWSFTGLPPSAGICTPALGDYLLPQGACNTAGFSCKGDVRQYCTGAQFTNFDCTVGGLSCVQDDGGSPCLAPGQTAKTAAACKESCSADDNSATFCVGGAPLTVACNDYVPGSRCKRLSSGGIQCTVFGD